jgi:hypothetical protein
MSLRTRKKSVAVPAVLSFVLLTGCIQPIIWDIEPSSGRAGDPVVVTATAPNIPLYPGTLDFIGVPFSVTADDWNAIEGLPFFHAVAVEVPVGVESGCVTLQDNFLETPSNCFFFTILE